jgi:hypothetical protein
MDSTTLSEAALGLLRLHRDRRGDIDVDDANRDAYRELARAGLMVPFHTFTGGREARYRLTEVGWKVASAPWLGGCVAPRP